MTLLLSELLARRSCSIMPDCLKVRPRQRLTFAFQTIILHLNHSHFF